MPDAIGLKRAFQTLYGSTPRLFSAPGRVNLIGEHTDYNEGFVLPMAVNRRTLVAAAGRKDSQIRIRSFDIERDGSFNLNETRTENSDHWLAYIEGVARLLKADGEHIVGANLAVSSDVPLGAGLSSSAALEVSVGLALIRLSGSELDLLQLALAAQKAEHLYAGTKCGIMDQLTAAFGQQEHALLIDCRSLEITPVRLNTDGVSIVVCNTNVKHDLASSAYNERRAECERGVEILSELLPGVRALRDVSVADFNHLAGRLPEPVRRRCRHVVSENERTLLAASALRKGEVAELGNLMTLSHQSLRDDYEVSCAELDAMVEIAMNHEGVAGARMTGGGFGGCTVNLVHQDIVDSFRDHVARAYEAATGIHPASYVVEADSGVSED